MANSPLLSDLDEVLNRTASLWPALRNRSVFVTGGTGFFGRWLLESFVAANHRFDLGAQAIVLTRNPDLFRSKAPELAEDPSIRLVRGNARSIELSDIQRQLADRPFPALSFIIHAASETTVAANRDDAAGVLRTSFEGTERALKIAEQSGASHFLLISSGACYGPQPTNLSHISESYTGAPLVTTPMSAYGEGKRVAELLCTSFARNHPLSCRIARCFAFVGPFLSLHAHYAIGNFIGDVLAKKSIQINGDGSPLRSYLYAGDLAAWLWALLLHPQASGAYNVGSDHALSIAEVAHEVARQGSANTRVNIARAANPQLPPERYIPDISRARRELGLDVWTPLNAAILKTIEFHQHTGPTNEI